MKISRFLTRWEEFLTRGKKESSFDFGVSNTCYIIFGGYGMSIYRYFRKGWHEKYVPDWRGMRAEQVAQMLAEQEWVPEC